MSFRLPRLLSLPLCVLLAAVSLAAEQPDGKKAEKQAAKKAEKQIAPRLFTFPEGIVLSEAQAAKLKDLQKEFAPKLAELQAKQNAILTKEQKDARAAAQKASREAGKKGPEVREAASAAAKITPEQETKLNEAAGAMKELRQQIEDKKLALLTAEQKAKLPKKGKAAKEK